MFWDVVIAAAIVILGLIGNNECHDSAFYLTNFDLTLAVAYLQVCVFSWFCILGELRAYSQLERPKTRLAFWERACREMLLQTYCVSIWPQQQWEATKTKKKKTRQRNGFISNSLGSCGSRRHSFYMYPLPLGWNPQERSLNRLIEWNEFRNLL